MTFGYLKNISSRCCSLVIFLKMSFRHLKQTLYRLGDLQTKLSYLIINWCKSSRFRYLLDILPIHLQYISRQSSFPKCLLDILNKPCLAKTISSQNQDYSKLINVSHFGGNIYQISQQYVSKLSLAIHIFQDIFQTSQTNLVQLRIFLEKIKLSQNQLIQVIQVEISNKYLSNTFLRYLLLVIFSKVSFRHLKQTLSRQDDFQTKLRYPKTK